MASSDLWTMIKSDGWVNPARLAVMPDGSVAKCPQAVAELEQVLTTVELPALKRWVGVSSIRKQRIPQRPLPRASHRRKVCLWVYPVRPRVL